MKLSEALEALTLEIHKDGYRWHATPQGVNKAIRTAAKLTGIRKRISAHTMRHSFATAVVRSGTDIRTLQTLLGHAHINTTQIYLHAIPTTSIISPLDQPDTNIIALPAAQAAPDRLAK
jgi:site-specific recombinase XerD